VTLKEATASNAFYLIQLFTYWFDLIKL
jgi:hypothetical protein